MMKEEWKVFIRGVEGRGDEVIDALKAVGGKINSNDIVSGDKNQWLYIINHGGLIDSWPAVSEIGKIIMDCYREVKLPEKWKDGNILTDCGNDFCVFQDYSENFPGMFRAYINFETCLQSIDDKLYDKDYYRLATEDEIAYFYNQLHKLGKDWDVEKKQLVDWEWKPKKVRIIGLSL